MYSSQANFQIVVEIRSGRNLENKKLVGSNSPYVEVKIGDEIRKTHVEYELDNPFWNETFKFEIKNEDNIPSSIFVNVQDDRALLPNINLGNYTINVDRALLIASLQQEPFYIIHEGLITLENTEHGQLDLKILCSFSKNKNAPSEWSNLTSPDTNDIANNIPSSVVILSDSISSDDTSSNVESLPVVAPSNQSVDNNVLSNNNNNTQSDLPSNEVVSNVPSSDQNVTEVSEENETQQPLYQSVNKGEFEKHLQPEFLFRKNDIANDESLSSETTREQIVHLLPPLKLKEKTIIVEKEIEYEKSIQVRQTIIHKEIPIIIEQPIIKEKYEHYREQPIYVKQPSQIYETTFTHEQDVGNLDEQEIAKLRSTRRDQFNDHTPVIQHEKEHIQLETEIREIPVQVHETKVVYQQPVEIEAIQIEKIQPKIVEEVKVEKEHVHQKVRPEIYVEDATYINEGHQYYSQNKDKTMGEKSIDSNSSNTMINNTNEKNIGENSQPVVI